MISDYKNTVHTEKEREEFNRITRLRIIEEGHANRIKQLQLESNKKHIRNQKNVIKLGEYKKSQFEKSKEK